VSMATGTALLLNWLSTTIAERAQTPAVSAPYSNGASLRITDRQRGHRLPRQQAPWRGRYRGAGVVGDGRVTEPEFHFPNPRGSGPGPHQQSWPADSPPRLSIAA